MKHSLCAICGGKVTTKKRMLDRVIDDQVYIFEKASVQVCNQCGEIWIPSRLAEQMERAVHGGLKPKRNISVPVY